MTENVFKMPSSKDRTFYRVDGNLYFHCELVDAAKGQKIDSGSCLIPTFELEENDFLGLSIDALREEILNDDPQAKDYFLKIQQLLAMMKFYVDAELLGRKHKMYRKIPVNISGSGMSFQSKTSYDKDALLQVSMFFPRYPFKFVSVQSNVVRCDKNETGYEIKVQFKDLSEKNQDEILRFVNQCQRDQRHSF